MNEMGLAPACAEDWHEERGVRRLRAVLTVLVVAALALPWTGCLPMLYRRDARCPGITADDPLLEIRLLVLTEPLRVGVVTPRPNESLYLLVRLDGEAVMVHEPMRRELLRSRCRPLAADDLAEVMRAVERLERSVVTERKVIRPGCREMTGVVLHGDRLGGFSYCGTTPPAEVVRFVEEISEPLGRRFGKELAAGLAATAPWASPVPPGQPRG